MTMDPPNRPSGGLPERALAPVGLVLVGLLALSPLPAVAQFTPHGAQFQVNSYSTGYQGWPGLAVGAAGEFVVVWGGPAAGGSDSDGHGILGQRFDALGRPIGGEFQVNSHTTADQYMAAVAKLASGEFVVTWWSEISAGTDSDETSIQARRFDANGVPLGPDLQVNTDTSGYQLWPAVVGMADGGYVVAWQSHPYDLPAWDVRIRARRFGPGGVPLGPEFPVSSLEASDRRDAALAAGEQGGFVVVWSSETSTGTDTSGHSIQARRFDDDAMPLGSEFQVNSFTQDHQGMPNVAIAPSGGFVVAWQVSLVSGPRRHAVRAQRFDAVGGTLGGEFEVQEFTFGRQNARGVENDGRGGFVVLWDDENDVYARHYRPDGTPSTPPLRINAYTTPTERFPVAAADRNGNLTVVWASWGAPGPDQDLTSIQGQRFDALFRDGVETGDTSRWSAFAP